LAATGRRDATLTDLAYCQRAA